MYSDIIDERMVTQNTYGIDIECGTGRWTKFLLDKLGFMEAIDPSDTIFPIDKLLGQKINVRLSKGSTDNIPFDDETFNLGMSIGVLHQTPNTLKTVPFLEINNKILKQGIDIHNNQRSHRLLEMELASFGHTHQIHSYKSYRQKYKKRQVEC
ncbi:MAG: class I SAM-dependent methyltransferase [Chitinophagaceae bacterium]